jgi:hypothetical protein
MGTEHFQLSAPVAIEIGENKNTLPLILRRQTEDIVVLC